MTKHTSAGPSSVPARPGRVTLADLRDTALVLDEVVAAVADPQAGGHAVFIGTVRDHDGGREVTALHYQAHPSATQRLRDVLEAVACRDGVIAAAAVHRTGPLVVGDVAVVAAVSAAHRGTAFDACERLVDELKQTVPIWKEQVFADGSTEWVQGL
ncbi:MAG TPA: molybdenum cofactor biosynthesis protein MoaE [Actinopolymorphaceae bacterium]|jgi:molybdopterin synthase catalytic subunit